MLIFYLTPAIMETLKEVVKPFVIANPTKFPEAIRHEN